MKKICLMAVLIVTTHLAEAQIDRTKAPQPSPAREIKIGEYQTFTLKNGLQVFVVENHKLPRVRFSISLKNDPILEGGKAGYVTLAGDLLGTGTKTRSKVQLDEEVDFIGANLTTSSTGISASSLSKHIPQLLELMADVLYNPAFSQTELDKLKTQTLSAISAEKDDPDAIANHVREALVYGKNHPYGEIATETSVNSITLEDCKKYYATYFKPNNAYLIIVGDMDLKNAKMASEKYFSRWIPGEVKNPIFAQPQPPGKTFVALVDRPSSVQSVIHISYPVDLKTGTVEAIKARVTNQILGGGSSDRLFLNLREKHGYTYGAYSQLISDPLVGNFNASASVRNAVTDSSVHELIFELKRIVNESVTDKELQDAKASIEGAFGRSLENPQTIAGFALNTAKFNLPKDYYNNYLKSVDAVTVADVQTTAKKFIQPEKAYILVVGKCSEIADKLKPYGEIRYYDIEGNNYAPSKTSSLPAGLKGEKVMSNYIEAIGGRDRLLAIKSLKMNYKSNLNGMDLTMSVIKKEPNKSVLEISANGMVFQKVICDGKDISISAMGQKRPIDEKTRENTIYKSAVIPELSLASAKANLTGMESVDGVEAYVVELILPSGGKSMVYFDATTGLKIQEVETQEGPQGNVSSVISYLDYKEVNGIKFPHTVIQHQGPMNLKLEILNIDVNPVVDDSIFKLE